MSLEKPYGCPLNRSGAMYAKEPMNVLHIACNGITLTVLLAQLLSDMQHTNKLAKFPH
jgi:hypothetical protein